MRICNLSSGSKGNCTYIESEKGKILLDIGVNAKYVELCLERLNVLPENIDAILITHEHSDHIKGVSVFARKYNISIYCERALFDVLNLQLNNCSHLIHNFDTDFFIKDMHIVPVELSHDSTACCGYKIIENDAVASFITDTGYCSDEVFEVIKSSAIVYLESNYDEQMLFACMYPTFLKKRIMSNKGHLSNLDCAKVIEKLTSTGTRLVVLSHISENSNTPALAFNTVKNYLESKNIVVNEHIKIGLTYQNKMGVVYKIKSNK